MKSLRKSTGWLLLLLVVPAAERIGAADEAEDQFAVAAGHYGQRRWELAVAEFQALIQEHPDHPKAEESLFFLAEALLQTRETTKAAEQFRRYLERQPSGKYARPALFRAGEAAYLAGEADRADEELKRFRSKYPNDNLGAYVLPYLGDLALAEDDVEAAVRYFRAGLTQFPKGRLQDDCRFGLARALERQDRNDEAKKFYQEVAAKPDSSLADDAQCHLGILQYATGNYTDAIEAFAVFEEKLADSPWRSNARLGHGWALRKLGRLDDAKSMFRKITTDPMVGVEAWYWLGIVEQTQENWTAAAEAMQTAAQEAGSQHKRLAEIYFQAGDSLLRAGKPREAAQQFERVIAMEEPDNPWLDDAICGQVRAALELKQHDEVDRLAAEFESKAPQSPLRCNVHRAWAQSRLARKQYAQAAELIEPLVTANSPSRAGSADPQGVQDRYLLALAYQGLRRNEEALSVLLPVFEFDSMDGPLKTDALLLQGTLLMALGRYSDAVEPLEMSLAGAPTDEGNVSEKTVKAQGEAAICHARTGQLHRAKQDYARLLQSHDQHALILPITWQLAEAAYEAEDLAWAAELFGRLQNRGEPKEYVLKGLAGSAWCQLKLEQLDQSVATFAKLLDAGPTPEMEAEAALARGRILARLGQSDSALAMYDRVIDRCPQASRRPHAMLAAARLHDKLQQDEESAAMYERLAEEYADWADVAGDGSPGAGVDMVLYEWAWVLDELGKTGESSDLFRRLRKEHPKSRYWIDASYRLARRAYAAKDYGQAGELVNEVLAAKPAATGNEGRIREDVLDLRGHLAVAENDWQRAEAAFTTLIEQFPESPKRLVAEYYIADAAYLQKDYKEAVRRFEKLSRKTRGRRDGWLAIVPLRHAQALAQLDRWADAREIAAEIERDYPDFRQQFEVDYLLGRCMAAAADLQGARDAYRKVIRSPAGAKTETAAMAQLMTAETYVHQKDYQTALREYWRVEMGYAYPSWQALALLQVGKCHEKLGEWKKASETYARLLKAYPNSEPARQASRRLRTPPGNRTAANKELPDR